MTTQEKITAIIAAVNEHTAIYAATKTPATPPAYNDTLATGLSKGLTERIAAIVAGK